MSDEPIIIGELEKLRKGWPETIEPVFDGCGEWHGKFDHSDNEHEGEGYLECDSWDTDNAELFAKLIAAEHNALPVLIAIAKAALTLAGPSKHSNAHIPEWNALLAALAKVRQ